MRVGAEVVVEDNQQLLLSHLLAGVGEKRLRAEFLHLKYLVVFTVILTEAPISHHLKKEILSASVTFLL